MGVVICMRSNKENLTSLYSYLQDDIITLKSSLVPVNKSNPRRMRVAYNAIYRPFRRI